MSEKKPVVIEYNFFWIALAAVIIGMMHYGYSCSDCGMYAPGQELVK
jgi:hypothetical protein